MTSISEGWGGTVKEIEGGGKDEEEVKETDDGYCRGKGTTVTYIFTSTDEEGTPKLDLA